MPPLGLRCVCLGRHRILPSILPGPRAATLGPSSPIVDFISRDRTEHLILLSGPVVTMVDLGEIQHLRMLSFWCGGLWRCHSISHGRTCATVPPSQVQVDGWMLFCQVDMQIFERTCNCRWPNCEDMNICFLCSFSLRVGLICLGSVALLG